MERKEMLAGALFEEGHTLAGALFARDAYPWEALSDIGMFIRSLGPTLAKDEYDEVMPGIWVAIDARVAESASLAGPCIIDHGAEIRHCAFIRGNALIGRGAVVGNSTELKNCVLFDGVQVPHFNYVGDSVLGYRSHMGAGAITSNVKSDKSLVLVRDGGDALETGLKKFGAILGDHVEVGCNAVLCPGAVIGPGSVVYPTACARGWLPARHILKQDGAVVAMR